MAFSVEQIRALAIKDVEIIGFSPDEQITLKLKTLSLLGLVGCGKIPNTLLGTAMELFEGKSNKGKDNESSKMSEMAKIMGIICENSMVEPEYKEIEDILTDEQKMEIFYYTQGGIKALESFREKQKPVISLDNGTSIQSKTK